MTLIKSLVASGLIVSAATPAAASAFVDLDQVMARIRTTLSGFVVASQPAPVQQAAPRPAPVTQAAARPAPLPSPVVVEVPQAAPVPVARKTVTAAPSSESYLDSLMQAASSVGSAAASAVSSFFNLTQLRADLSRQVIASNSIVPTPTSTSTGTVAAPVNVATAQSFQESAIAAGGSIEPIVSEQAGETGTTYYVDFASGNDSNSGTSISRPWKRAPGDPLATGTAAAATLVGGDTVRFRGGVSYRGSIKMKFSGDPGAPILYAGTGFGTGNAIIDGADAAATSVPCPSQSACGNAPNWTSLRLVTFTAPTTSYTKLYDALGPLGEAIVPNMADPFFGDDIDSFAVTPKAAATAIAAGRLDNAQLAAAALGQPQARVALWVKPNKVVERDIISISGSTIFFDATDVTPYTDRDGRAAIVGSVKGLTKPGGFALLGTGKAVVYPRSGGGTQVFVGSGRSGIDLNGAANIRITGLRFVRGTSSSASTREGIAITNISGTPANIAIEGNFFGPLAMRNGYGAINLSDATNLTIRGNRFTDLQWSSGIRLGTGVVGAVIEGNRLNRGGRTGIYMQGSRNVTVRANILSGFGGVHGNAMSAYLGNRSVAFIGNCVFNSARPLTFHGDDGLEPNDIRVTGNILVADADASAAIQSWGKGTRVVNISGNLLLGPKFGAILNADDIGVTATRNRTSGITVSGGAQPGDWVVSQNDDGADYATARAAASLSIDRCSATGPAGNITVTPL
jgi:parallel beta-helix repeat protein